MLSVMNNKVTKKINFIELLEKRGLYEVLYAVAIEGYVRWIDIVYSVQQMKGPFSTTTIRKRLENLVAIEFIEKKERPKARAEYTYHATEIAKKYALSVRNMLEETKSADKKDLLIIDDPELVNEVLEKSIEQGYDSPQDFLRAALSKMNKEKRNNK